MLSPGTPHDRIRPPALRIGIDTGRTFTDIVAVGGSSEVMRLAKVASTPSNPPIGLVRIASTSAMTVWRPQQKLRPVAVGVVRRGDRILVMAVRDDDGKLKGWRPLGGTIEFGERAADALKREFMEELGRSILEPVLITVIENFYTHHGTSGHEIVFVFEAAFKDGEPEPGDGLLFTDGGVTNEVAWVPLGRFRTNGEHLFPLGLIEKINRLS